MCLFLASGSLGFLFSRATQKYSAAWRMLEWILRVRCPGLRLLQQKAASLSTLSPPLQPPLTWSQGGFFLARWLAHRPSQEAGGSSSAVTWFCAKSAALCLLGGGKRGCRLGSCHSGDTPCGLVGRGGSLITDSGDPPPPTPPPHLPPRLHFQVAFVIHRTAMCQGVWVKQGYKQIRNRLMKAGIRTGNIIQGFPRFLAE